MAVKYLDELFSNLSQTMGLNIPGVLYELCVHMLYSTKENAYHQQAAGKSILLARVTTHVLFHDKTLRYREESRLLT